MIVACVSAGLVRGMPEPDALVHLSRYASALVLLSRYASALVHLSRHASALVHLSRYASWGTRNGVH